MKDWKSQAHVKWECKYHVVILPKYRKRALYGKLRREIGSILRELCRYKGIELEGGKVMADHIHMLLSIPPKYKYSDGNRISESQERDTNSSWTNEDERGIVRPFILVAWIFRVDGWSG